MLYICASIHRPEDTQIKSGDRWFIDKGNWTNCSASRASKQQQKYYAFHQKQKYSALSIIWRACTIVRPHGQGTVLGGKVLSKRRTLFFSIRKAGTPLFVLFYRICVWALVVCLWADWSAAWAVVMTIRATVRNVGVQLDLRTCTPSTVFHPSDSAKCGQPLPYTLSTS